MGRDFYEKFDVVRSVFAEADTILGFNLTNLILDGPADQLTLTKNSQVAIYVLSFAIYKAFAETYPNVVPYVCAGLSLGEYTALTVSGRISFEEGLKLVQKRALLMQEACELLPGSMRVVLGLDEFAIGEALKPLEGLVSIANLNCPGQVVIAGTLPGLDLAAEALKNAGAKRVLPLDVSGGFHSFLMKPAKEGLTPFLLNLGLKESKVHFVMNTTGGFVEDPGEIRQNLVSQVTRPVYWQKGIEAMLEKGVSGFIEIGCGKTLQGMNKRIGVKVPTCSIEKVEELQQISKEKGFAHVIA